MFIEPSMHLKQQMGVKVLFGSAPIRTQRVLSRVIEETHKPGQPGGVKYKDLGKLLRRPPPLNTPELKAVLKTTAEARGLLKAQVTEHSQRNYGIGNSKSNSLNNEMSQLHIMY